jgi:ATP-dependent Clp protease adaptor protein ClpS
MGHVIPDVERDERTDSLGRDGGPWIVILYNCDCHTFDEVVGQLQKATGCTAERAWQIAVEAHYRGRAVAHTGSEEECDRAAAVLRAIRLRVETDCF